VSFIQEFVNNRTTTLTIPKGPISIQPHLLPQSNDIKEGNLSTAILLEATAMALHIGHCFKVYLKQSPVTQRKIRSLCVVDLTKVGAPTLLAHHIKLCATLCAHIWNLVGSVSTNTLVVTIAGIFRFKCKSVLQLISAVRGGFPGQI
jgi:hypothetical protein